MTESQTLVFYFIFTVGNMWPQFSHKDHKKLQTENRLKSFPLEIQDLFNVLVSICSCKTSPLPPSPVKLSCHCDINAERKSVEGSLSFPWSYSMPQLRFSSSANRGTGERMDLLSGFQGGWGKWVGQGIDQDACIFPLHTALSNLGWRTLELKETLEIIESTHSFFLFSLWWRKSDFSSLVKWFA